MISSPVANQPLVTTYGYDNGGRLTSTTYSDSTPSVSITYDALGRQLTQSNGVATSEFAYNPANLQIDTETVTYNLPGQAAFTRIIDRSQDALGRDTGFQLKTENSTLENSASYTYGATVGRLSSVAGASGSGSFQYAYTPNSNLIESVTGPAHTVTNTWEATRNALKTKINATSSGAVSSFDYTVNAIGQRTAMRPVLDGNNDPISTFSPSWDWSYNALGELVEADDQSGTNNRAYEYDAIGNRKKAIEGLAGDLASAPVNYVANALNQYTTAEGVALPDTPAPAPYDADGNMRFDGGVNQDDESREYLWDGENRLIAVKRVADDVTLVSYEYDPFSRLIATTIGTTTTRYLYDGWNRIAEYVENGTGHVLKRSYLWGMDLSGTMQGAGGVGGLLAMTIHEAQSTTYYPTYDGNGNISEYISETGAVAAHFEYDPFGGLTVDTENNAAQFPYRFSTKPQDLTTGLFYYGYRWYDPVTGRWPSRDPIEEEGGINLYGFAGNDGVNKWDVLGLIIDKTFATKGTDIEGTACALYQYLRKDFYGKVEGEFLDAGTSLKKLRKRGLDLSLRGSWKIEADWKCLQCQCITKPTAKKAKFVWVATRKKSDELVNVPGGTHPGNNQNHWVVATDGQITNAANQHLSAAEQACP